MGNYIFKISDDRKISVKKTEIQLKEPINKFRYKIYPRIITDSIIFNNDKVFATDLENHSISVFSTDGNFLRRFGKKGSKEGNLNYPSCLTIYQNELYVADTFNNRISVFDVKSGKYLRCFGTEYLEEPQGITIYKNHVYVVDTNNHRICVFSNKGILLKVFGDKCSRKECLKFPKNIMIYDNKIYVTDSFNNRISVFDIDGNSLFSFGSEGWKRGKFKYPHSIIIFKNEIYVTDCCRCYVLVFNLSGKFVREFGGRGSEKGQFRFPTGMAISYDNNLLISDCLNFAIHIYSLKKF